MRAQRYARSVLLPLLVACDASAPPPVSVALAAPPTGARYGDTRFRADGPVRSASISNAHDLVTLDHDGVILRFRLPTGERVGRIADPCDGTGQRVALSPSGRWLAVACYDNVRIGRVGSDAWARSPDLDLSTSEHTLAWSPREDALMVAGPAMATLLGTDARPLATAPGPAPLVPVSDAAWAGTSDYDGTRPVRGWSVGGDLWSVPVPLGTYEAVRGIAPVTGDARLAVLTDREVHWFRPDGTHTTTPNGRTGCCDDEIVGVGPELWVRRRGALVRLRQDGTVAGALAGYGRELVASPDGAYVAAVGLARVEVWRGDGTRLTGGEGLGNAATTIRWSPDGRVVAASDGERVLRVDLRRGRMRELALAGIESLAWGPDGALAMAGRPGAWLWGEPPVPLSDEISAHHGVAFGRDGVLRTYGCPEGRGQVTTWALGPPKRVATAPFSACLAVLPMPAPDGRHLLAVPVSADDAELVDANGAHVATLGRVDDAVWLPDGTLRLVKPVGGDLDNAEIWTWPGPEPVASSGWPPARTAAVAPDGRTAASWSAGTLTVWDVATRAAVRTYDTSEPVRMRFSPDSASLAFTADDGILSVVAAR